MMVNATFISLMLCALGLTLLLSIVLIFPWLRLPKRRLDLLDLNVSVFRERLAELERDYQKNQLDQADYSGRKIDLERQLLAAHEVDDSSTVSQMEKRAPPVVIGLVFLWIPILAFSGYFYFTNPDKSNHHALFKFWIEQDRYAQLADDLMTGKIAQNSMRAEDHSFELLQAMQTNAHQHPFDARRWLHLSKFYLAAGDLDSALASLAHAYRLTPEDNNVAMRYAQMRFLSEQGKIDTLTQTIVSRILLKDPNHEGALLLMSIAADRDQRYDQTVYWLQRLKQVRLARANPSQPIDPKVIVQLDQTINDAKIARAKQLANKAKH